MAQWQQPVALAANEDYHVQFDAFKALLNQALNQVKTDDTVI